MISKLEAWDADVVVQNHALRENLKDATNRTASVKVALACLKAEFAKSTFETASVYSWVWNIVKVKVLRQQGEQIGVSNLRELGLSISEHSRNIVGICASPFMSPQAAASTFLTQGPDLSPQSPKEYNELALLIATAEAVDFVATKLSTPLRACSGTALGMYRCGGFIRGDDDVDTMFDEKHLPVMNFLMDEGIFEKMTGLRVFNQKKHTSGWQVYHDKAEKSQGSNEVPVGYFVDVMPVREENGNFVFSHDGMRQRFLNDYMTKEEFTNLTRKPFGPITLNVPEKWRDYLVRAYREQGLKLSYKFVSHQIMGAALANPTNVRRMWAFVSGIFESKRRMAITNPTPYNQELYETSRKEIFDRISHFQEELKVNQELAERFQKNTIPYRVFVDGVYDLFHHGHARSFEKAIDIAKPWSFGRKIELIVGVCGDEDSSKYKRIPFMNEKERELAVSKHPLVSKVISRSPTDGPTKEFLVGENINLVLHGDDFDEEKCRKYYSNAMNMGIFRTYPYEPGISTTDLKKSAEEKGTFPEAFVNLTGIDQQVLIDRICSRMN